MQSAPLFKKRKLRMSVALTLISILSRNLKYSSFSPQDSSRCERIAISKVFYRAHHGVKTISVALKRIITLTLIWYVGSASRAGVCSEWSFRQRTCRVWSIVLFRHCVTLKWTSVCAYCVTERKNVVGYQHLLTVVLYLTKSLRTDFLHVVN